MSHAQVQSIEANSDLEFPFIACQSSGYMGWASMWHGGEDA